MTDAVILRVPGVPAPKGSKDALVLWPKGAQKCPTCGNRFGRPRAILVDGRRGSPQKIKLEAWKAAIAGCCDGQRTSGRLVAPFDGPVRVRIAFWLPKPKSTAGWRWLAWQKPDVDKLERATLDGLTDGRVFADDAQVVDLWSRKLYATGSQSTGAVISIEPLAEMEQQLGHAWMLSGGPPPRLR